MLFSDSLANNSLIILDDPESPIVLIGGTKGFVPSSWRNSLEDNISRSGENTGNLVFQHAINKILKQNKLFISKGERFTFNDVSQDHIGFFLMPAANHLRIDADWSDFNGFLQKIRKPIIVVGLGAQSQLGMSAYECAANLRENKSITEFVRLLEDKAIYIGYRGQFSMDVGTELGLTKGDIIGCPSLFINKNPHLGKLLRQQIDCLSSFTIDNVDSLSNFLCLPESPYSFQIGSEQATIQRMLLELAMSNNGFLLQQSGGSDAINYFTGNFSAIDHEKLTWIHEQYQSASALSESQRFMSNNGLLFFSAHEWMNAMSDMIFSVGPRFHGNMLSIASSRLGVVIFHDARTSELAECMEIPRISRQDFIHAFQTNNPMHYFFSSIRFDPERFDMTRKALAKKWKDLSDLTGISLADYVVGLANG